MSTSQRSWETPCGHVDDEAVWCATHLAQLIDVDRQTLSTRVSEYGGFVDASVECGARSRGRAIPRGVVLALDLDIVGRDV